MSLSPDFPFIDALSPEYIGRNVAIKCTVNHVTIKPCLVRALVKCYTNGCDWTIKLEGTPYNPVKTPVRCPGCKQRNVGAMKIEYPKYYALKVSPVNSTDALMAYVISSLFDSSTDLSMRQLRGQSIIIRGALHFFDGFKLVAQNSSDGIELAEEAKDDLHKMDNLARGLYSNLNLNEPETKKILRTMTILDEHGGSANRTVIADNFSPPVSEKTVDRWFQRAEPMRLKNGELWNPYIDFPQGRYASAFHTRPVTSLTIFGECLCYLHQNFEKRQRKPPKLSQ